MATLPEFLRPYFWEVDPAIVSLSQHRSYVIERILEYGDDRAIRWLKDSFPAEAIRGVLRTSRSLSPNTVRLWWDRVKAFFGGEARRLLDAL